MPLPVQTTTCSTGPSVGGLPAIQCEVPEGGPTTVNVQGAWNALGPEGLPLPALVFGFVPSALGWPSSVFVETGLAVLTEAPDLPPTAADVPADFQEFGGNNQELVGVFLPLEYVGDLPAGPLWVKTTATDAVTGCSVTFYAYLPEGIPDTDQVDVPVYLIGAEEAPTTEAVLLEIPAAPEPVDEEPQPGDVVNTDLDVTTVCPPPGLGLAVTPACGFPVQIDQEDPVEVTIVDAGGALRSVETGTEEVVVEGDWFAPGDCRMVEVHVAEDSATVAIAGHPSDEANLVMPGVYRFEALAGEVLAGLRVNLGGPGNRVVITWTKVGV